MNVRGNVAVWVEHIFRQTMRILLLVLLVLLGLLFLGPCGLYLCVIIQISVTNNPFVYFHLVLIDEFYNLDTKYLIIFTSNQEL